MQDYEGLSTEDARRALLADGPNRLPEKKKNMLLAFVRGLLTPVSLMMLAAAVVSLAIGKTVDFWVILALFFSNSAISLWHEHKADTSIRELQKRLAVTVDALRDGAWGRVDSAELVAGDVIRLRVGMVVPADVVMLGANNLSVNESVLTGESLPKEKTKGDKGFSGSFVTTGDAVARVSETGARTFFGKTVSSIETGRRRSSLERDILSISKFISLVSVAVVAVLTVVLIATHANPLETVTLDLSLLIAGVPVALPTVMSLIISFGVVALARKQVVVRRLASLEELANVDLLLSDKTGTLTENLIEVGSVTPFAGFTERDVVLLARSAVSDDRSNPIDRAVIDRAGLEGATDGATYPQKSYVPGDSVRKRSSAVIDYRGKPSAVTLGAPQVVAGLCTMDPGVRAAFDRAVTEAGSGGYRVLALAIREGSGDEHAMSMAGIMLLGDRLRPDARETVSFMNANGIAVKMVTGDSLAISGRVSEELGLSGEEVEAMRDELYIAANLAFECWQVSNKSVARGRQRVLDKKAAEQLVGVQMLAPALTNSLSTGDFTCTSNDN